MSDKTSQRHWRGPMGKGLLVLGSLAASLLVAEGIVRLANLAPAFRPIIVEGQKTVYQRSDNPLLAYELKPNHRDDDADLVESYPYINAHGQRDRERLETKPDGVERVLLLGDSVVEGLGIRELDALLPARLEALYAGREVEVLNFGVSGYNSLAEVELLATKGLRFDPDWVVVVFVENDFNNFNREAFDLASRARRPGWARWLFRRSDLARLTFVRFDWFQFGAEQDPIAWNREAMGDNNVVTAFHRLSELARQHGFHVLIGIWPRFLDEGIQDRYFMPGQSDQLVVEALADEFGLDSFRFSAAFAEAASKEDATLNPRLRYTIGDEMHPSGPGVEIAAAALHREIENRRQRLMTRGAADSDGEAIPNASAEDAVDAAEVARGLGGQEPNDAVVYYNRGRALETSGDLAGAKAAYRAAVEANPRYAEALNNLGVLTAESGDVGEALRLFEQAMAADRNFHQAYMNWSQAKWQAGDLESAQKGYRQALAIRPQLAEAHLALGQLAFLTGDPQEAERHLQAAESLNQELVEVHHLMGVIVGQRGQMEEAARRFRRALELAPNRDDIRAKMRLVTGPEALGQQP